MAEIKKLRKTLEEIDKYCSGMLNPVGRCLTCPDCLHIIQVIQDKARVVLAKEARYTKNV